MNQFSFGRYQSGDSFWHRSDPLLKLLLVLAVVAASALARNHAVLIIAACVGGFVWLTAGLTGRLLIAAFRSFAWLLLAVIVANIAAVLTNSGLAWPSRLTAAVATAGIVTIRFGLLLTGAAWLTGTTTPLALMGALGRAIMPLRRLGLPSAELVLIMGLGFRLFPDLLETGGRVRLAQRARGVGVGRTWRARLVGVEALAMALFVFAFRRADELALAMEARGYRPGQGLKVKKKRLALADLLVLAACLGLFITLFWLGRR